MEIICGVLAIICLIAGILLLLCPRVITRISRVTDREISTDRLQEVFEKKISIEKLADILNKEISTEKVAEFLTRQVDINEKLIKFDRLIGLGTLIVGIVMIWVFLKILG